VKTSLSNRLEGGFGLEGDTVRVDEARDTYLEAVLIGGREPVAITIVDYDEGWPRHFVGIAEQIRRALGRKALTVEHIGSTAVPGLPAKPIIDVLLTVAEVDDETAYVPELESTRINRLRHEGPGAGASHAANRGEERAPARVRDEPS
jgi:GrpB-like predicted nucleotidyltransferase (UPF0157 family)